MICKEKEVKSMIVKVIKAPQTVLFVCEQLIS